MSTFLVSRGVSVAPGKRLVRAALLVLICYLFQVSVLPHLKIFGLMPNLLMVCIAVLTVSYGKKYAFLAGAAIGIIVESMASKMILFHVLVFPSLALLCAQMFSDMSDLKREMRRIRLAEMQAKTGVSGAVRDPNRRFKLRQFFTRTSPDDLEPHLRIFLNALALTGLYEGLLLVYIALEGAPLGLGHLLRCLVTLGYTAALCLLMVPMRAFLGMYKSRRQKAGAGNDDQEEVLVSEKRLRQMAVVPDMPDDIALSEVSVSAPAGPAQQTAPSKAPLAAQVPAPVSAAADTIPLDLAAGPLDEKRKGEEKP